MGLFTERFFDLDMELDHEFLERLPIMALHEIFS